MEKKRVSLIVCVLAIILIAGVAEAQDITTGLIAHWKLDETSGTTAYDSVGSNDGSLVGDPCWVTGMIDGALDFPGGTHYVDCGNDTSLDVTGSRSVAAWVKVDNWVDAWDSIVSKGDMEGNYDLLRNRLVDAMAFYVAGATAARGSIPVKDGYWHLAVGVYDNPAGTVSLYIDGVLDVSESVAPDLVIGTNTANVRINGLHVPGDPSYDEVRHIDGMIDDVRIYSRALTADDIAYLYSLANLPPQVDAGAFQAVLVNTATQLDAIVSDDGNPTPPSLTYAWSKLSGPGTVTFLPSSDIEDPCVTLDAAGVHELQLSVSDGEKDACDVLTVLVRANNDPVAYWDFETGSGTNVVDRSVNNNFGTLAGEPNWVAGWIGDWALEVLDASYVAITTDLTADPNLDAMYGAVTVSTWIKIDSWLSPNWNGIVTKGDGGDGGAGGWSLIRNSNKDSLAFYTPEAGFVSGSVSVRDGYWHHVAAVHDGFTTSLYVDGTLDASAAASGLIKPNTAEIWINGNSEYPGDRFFAGLIDDVRIYGYGLNADQVADLADMGVLVPRVDVGEDQLFLMQYGYLQLDGTVIDDGKPVAATLEWTADPCTGVVFSDTSIEAPTVTFSEVGTYVLRLTADDTLATVYDEATITVENPTCQDVIDDGLLISADLSGPEGKPDCQVDLYDFAVIAGYWLKCNDPQDPECEFPFSY